MERDHILPGVLGSGPPTPPWQAMVKDTFRHPAVFLNTSGLEGGVQVGCSSGRV